MSISKWNFYLPNSLITSKASLANLGQTQKLFPNSPNSNTMIRRTENRQLCYSKIRAHRISTWHKFIITLYYNQKKERWTIWLNRKESLGREFCDCAHTVHRKCQSGETSEVRRAETCSASRQVTVYQIFTPLTHRDLLSYNLCFIFSRGYAKRRNDYCCGLEYANLSLTPM